MNAMNFRNEREVLNLNDLFIAVIAVKLVSFFTEKLRNNQ